MVAPYVSLIDLVLSSCLVVSPPLPPAPLSMGFLGGSCSQERTPQASFPGCGSQKGERRQHRPSKVLWGMRTSCSQVHFSANTRTRRLLNSEEVDLFSDQVLSCRLNRTTTINHCVEMSSRHQSGSGTHLMSNVRLFRHLGDEELCKSVMWWNQHYNMFICVKTRQCTVTSTKLVFIRLILEVIDCNTHKKVLKLHAVN